MVVAESLPDRNVRIRRFAVPAAVVLLAATAVRIPPPSLPAYLYFVLAGVVLAVIDLERRRLPNLIVLPSYPVVAALLAASSLWRHDFWPLARAGIGGVLLLVFFLVLATAQPSAMGLGDVKLAGLIGLALGYLSWSALLFGCFAGVLLGGIAGVALTVRGRRKATIPYGPFLIAGALLGVLL
ncbi:prepilin peptidase [Kutzneria sp. CA-103260]|uniref:prepilin peptidase n=1 Tax=Kutzneria sp. CA-103260 TaxID=2802641 RepID=UPI001BABA715|nr:A24 family peptidase [Kutzneria sp. CA-103260]QUQ65871.1 leader peptidase (prepilin peptidase)/N-methyltransferase [Kutzneria sp. CA-103260]